MGKKKRSDKGYRFSAKDWAKYGLRFLVKGGLICYLFFDSGMACLLLAPFAVYDYRSMKKEKLAKQNRQLSLQFKELLDSLATSLGAGYSLEKAFTFAGADLELVCEKKAAIFGELNRILSGIRNNVSVEVLLKDFGHRSGNEDIKNFAYVVAAAKKSGGNLVSVIQKTVNCMMNKIAVEEEIATMVAAKKLEQKVMLAMPYGIIFYLRVGNGGFFDVLYHNLLGGMLMLVFLTVIYIADYWAGRIMEIRV